MQNDNEAWVARARAVRIEDECARRNITLKGNTERCGPCPKCGGEDRFAINTTKQVFNCRGCEVGGDVIELVQHLDGIDFVKAVEKLTGEPPPKSKKKKGKSAGGAQTYSPTIARYVYRQADGTPYLQVCRTQAKKFFQNRWNGQMWIPGKPAGPKLPYRLPELLAAAPTTPVHLCEGEKDVDALAKLGFVATTNSEGAGNWADNLNAYFRDRSVYIHEDNDKEGRKRCQRIARALEPIAKTVRIICLPDLPEHGDVSDWLQHDPSGAQLARLCESAPCWEPPADDASEEVEKEKPDEDDIEVSSVWKKQADVLIDLAASAELFHDSEGVMYARFTVAGHKENWPLRSKGFKRWLTRAYYEATQAAPRSEAMQQALGVLEARAQFDAPEHEVRVRVASHGNARYIDLCDQDWRAIEIDEDAWRIVDEAPVYFRRSGGMKPLHVPMGGGSLEKDLRPLLNVKTDNEFVLAVAWLLAALRDCGPYPVLAIAGEQGSAKSTLVRILRALVDPNSVPLRALPRNEHDVFIAARNAHVLPYDNVSDLPDWLSDTLCRLATGGGFSTRELYSDQDEVLFEATRPVLLNGITDVATRPDLAARAIVLTLAPIPDDQRKREEKVWADFEERAPRIFGALLTAVAHGLKTLPDVVLDRLPRMADFAVWATACEGAMWPAGTFMAAYAGNLEEAVELVLEADQVAQVLRSYVSTKTADPRFEGTSSELLRELNGTIPESQQKAKGWPRRPADLSKILRRIAPPLRKVGIETTFDREGKGRNRKILITFTPGPESNGKMPSAPSAPSAANYSNDLWRTAGERAAVRQEPSAVREGNGAAQADGKTGMADSSDFSAAPHNPLKEEGTDSADSRDSRAPILSGREGGNGGGDTLINRHCDYCGSPGVFPGDPVAPWDHPFKKGVLVWLHQRCQAPWFDQRGMPSEGPLAATAASSAAADPRISKSEVS